MRPLDWARIVWQLDQPVSAMPCGCRWLLSHALTIDRRVYWCPRHRPGWMAGSTEKRH